MLKRFSFSMYRAIFSVRLNLSSSPSWWIYEPGTRTKPCNRGVSAHSCNSNHCCYVCFFNDYCTVLCIAGSSHALSLCLFGGIHLYCSLMPAWDKHIRCHRFTYMLPGCRRWHSATGLRVCIRCVSKPFDCPAIQMDATAVVITTCDLQSVGLLGCLSCTAAAILGGIILFTTIQSLSSTGSLWLDFFFFSNACT